MALNLVECEWDAETAGDLPERRWFAMLSAIKNMQADCAVLLEASRLAEAAWRRSCAHLAQFESLRDALEEEIAAKPAGFTVRRPQQLKFEARKEFLGADKR